MAFRHDYSDYARLKPSPRDCLFCSRRRSHSRVHSGSRFTEGLMKRVVLIGLLLGVCFTLLAAAPEDKSPKPQYDAKGQLLRPHDYREWVVLSPGFRTY